MDVLEQLTMAAVGRIRLPVSSSARTIGGSLASARASARCCSPPDAATGNDGRGGQSDFLQRRARPDAGFATPLISIGTATFYITRSATESGEELEHEADLLAAEPGERVFVSG
jgi:hypothetical protein